MSVPMDTAVEDHTSPATSDAQSLLALSTATSAVTALPPPVDFLLSSSLGTLRDIGCCLMLSTLLLLTV